MTTELSRIQTEDRLALLARTIAKGASSEELALFDGICTKTGLDPFTRQIYLVARWDARERREVRAPQVSIDGMRLTAQRSGEYEGQTQAAWCGADGVWRELWLGSGFPFAARVGVWRKQFREPLYATALWSEYCQTTKDGTPSNMWSRMPSLMLAKCAEALALRKAFPAELSGLYTAEEMSQASTASPQSDATTSRVEAPKTLPSPVLLSSVAVEVSSPSEPITIVPPSASITVVKNKAGASIWKVEIVGDPSVYAITDASVANVIESNKAFACESRVLVHEVKGKKIIYAFEGESPR